MSIAYAAETVHETTTAGVDTQVEATGVLASLGINGTLFAFQLINFAIVALVIWFLVLKPLTKKMSERQDKITESLIKAEEVQTNLRRSEIKYQEKIDEAKSEAAKILEKSQDEAKLIADKFKTKSKQEIELLVLQAKKNIQIEKDEMIIEINEFLSCVSSQ